jgi:hypothetical protein
MSRKRSAYPNFIVGERLSYFLGGEHQTEQAHTVQRIPDEILHIELLKNDHSSL